MDTSATVIGWAMSELIKHPHIMKKLQEELENEIGLDKIVEESDLERLEYLKMVVKEIFRLYPPAPLLLPHESLQDCIVDGFHIPKKSRIIINVWAIGRDRNSWIDPHKFDPERFIDSQVDVKGRDFQLIPFGSGRRGCPGMQLGLTLVQFVLAQLVHCFDWMLSNGMPASQLDMTEEFGLTCPRLHDLIDVLSAAMDTSATAIDWALAELIKHPQAMKELQVELEKVVGLNRMVEESHLEHLQYLGMVIKEVLRLHPPAPLLVPHESLEDCTVDGFHIPKKSRIFVNAWSIGQDPNVWIDPQKFFPERFIHSLADVKGRDFHLIPFGSGRRSCPGIHLGLLIVSLVVANLVHCFDWELPNCMLATDLDMEEEFGLTCPRAQELMLIPTYRLRN
ncbi:hypothetical protein Csa_004100 [Cucumis sativus]|nr:hypothetical protein Csa_004100 [Cucumis sativus]